MEMLQPSFNVKSAKKKDILRAILTNPKKCSFPYDTINYKVTDLELKYTVLVDFHIAFLKLSSFHCCVCYMLNFSKALLLFLLINKTLGYSSQGQLLDITVQCFASIIPWEAHLFFLPVKF